MLDPQLFVSVKLAVPVGVIAMLVNVTVADELFVTVTGVVVETPTVLLPNAMLVGLSVSEPAATPVPVNVTCCVPALSVSVTKSFFAPALCGSNETWIVHIPPAARLAPQLFVSV
jgi:hypothetical protein